MAKGGYRILDLKKSALTSGEAANISGAYDGASNQYGKAIMVSGLIVGDVEYPDFFAVFIPGEQSYSAGVVIGGKSINIAVASGDDVTVTVAD